MKQQIQLHKNKPNKK